MKNNNNNHIDKRKHNAKILIASMLIGTVAIGAAVITTVCMSPSAEEIPTQATAATQTITEKATSATAAVTAAPSEKATQKPTQASTQKPTQKPIQKPTQTPAQKPTVKPAEPTVKPTQETVAEPTEAATQASADQPAEAATVTPTQPLTEIETGSSAYEVLKNVISTSKANGYAVVKLDGMNTKALILSVGKDKENRSLKIYKIGSSELIGIGKISTANATLYLNKAGSLSVYKAEKNAYSYGAVTIDKTGKPIVAVAQQGTIKEGGSYPAIPGMKLSLTPITDLSGISEYK